MCNANCGIWDKKVLPPGWHVLISNADKFDVEARAAG